MPRRRIGPDEPYAGRRPDGRGITPVVDHEGWKVLRTYCRPGRRMTGTFLGRLILEHTVRQEERRTVLAAVAAGNDEDVGVPT
jgi:hypothetical protein